MTIFYFIILLWIIYKSDFFSDEIIPKKWFIGIFSLKVLSSIILTLIYTYYYTDRSTTDIYKYFDDSKIMFESIHSKPLDFFRMIFGLDAGDYFRENYYSKMNFWYRNYETDIVSDSHVIIRFNALFQLISLGNIYVHNVFINIISFIGLTALFKFFKPFLFPHLKVLFIGVFMVPSVLFWGSGLLKEGFILFGIGMLFYSLQQLLIHYKWKYLIFLILGIFSILYNKSYLLVVLIIPIFSYIFYQKSTKKSILKSVGISIVLFCFTWFILWITIGINPFDLIVNKHQEFLEINVLFESKSAFEIPGLTDTWSVLINTPTAWFNTIFRPFLWENRSPLVVISAIENFLFFGLILLAFIFPKKSSKHWFIVLLCLIFVLSLFAIVGLIVPNFGALVRYKVPALPFFTVGLLLMIDLDKLKSRFKILNSFV